MEHSIAFTNLELAEKILAKVRATGSEAEAEAAEAAVRKACEDYPRYIDAERVLVSSIGDKLCLLNAMRLRGVLGYGK